MRHALSDQGPNGKLELFVGALGFRGFCGFRVEGFGIWGLKFRD